MLIDRFAPRADAVEVHRRPIPAPPPAVWRALWSADLGAPWLVRGLIFLRSLPQRLAGGEAPRRERRRFTLESLIGAAFGWLAEDSGREIVLGVAGRFWRPSGNLDPFVEADFGRPVPAGRARAIWNFRVLPAAGGASILETETRIVCGDPSSRRKFRAYWLLVRPFSGLIRRVMLRTVAEECRRRTKMEEQSANPLAEVVYLLAVRYQMPPAEEVAERFRESKMESGEEVAAIGLIREHVERRDLALGELVEGRSDGEIRDYLRAVLACYEAGSGPEEEPA